MSRKKVRRSVLRKLDLDIENASNYHDYREACAEFDRVSGMDEWKADPYSKEFDHELISKRIARLKHARDHNSPRELMTILHEGIHGNLGNIANPQLYSHTRVGTKYLIEEFLNAVCGALDDIYRADEREISLYQKLRFFEETAHAYGQSCLLLSGGAGLGFFHCGVVKCLLENGLLPNVVSGSSAGSIIAASIGTRTNSELMELLQPEFIHGKLNTWHTLRGFDIIKEKSLLDPTPLENALIDLFGLTTFEEAYERTGRYINITVSPADLHQHSRMLNTITSPIAIITMAVRASCAIPYLFSPVQLKAKEANGNIRDYIPHRKYADGSIMADTPITRLARLFGVNHSIVSQTNPLAVPFLSRSRNESIGVVEMTKRHVANLAKVNSIYACNIAEELLPNRMTRLGVHKVKSVIEQQYVGDINIIPPRNIANLRRVLSTPNLGSIRSQLETAERATWPVLEMIKNTTQISIAFQRYLKLLKKQEEISMNKGLAS